MIPISTACRQALAACQRQTCPSEYVFLTQRLQPYSIATVNRYFKKAKLLAGITRRLRFHDLRHSFASLLASKSVPLQVIAKALGHSSALIGERYARPDETALKAVASALDSVRTGEPFSI